MFHECKVIASRKLHPGSQHSINGWIENDRIGRIYFDRTVIHTTAWMEQYTLSAQCQPEIGPLILGVAIGLRFRKLSRYKLMKMFHTLANVDLRVDKYNDDSGASGESNSRSKDP